MAVILIIHSLLRWFVLLFGILAIIDAIRGITGNKPYTRRNNRMSLFFMISFDIQLLFGMILYMTNGWFDYLKEGMGTVMKDPIIRFFTIEHALMMLLAWALVHISRSAVKRATTDISKHKKSLIFSGLALLIVLISIPWPFREVGRQLFPF
ncbi:MAG: hypothetical protein KF829_05925 [Ferruginibacter sp.]|nr:hypothetical protein [Ferruginibacter sp.]